MSRINIQPKFLDFVAKAATNIDTWFRQVTLKLNSLIDGPLVFITATGANAVATGVWAKVGLNATVYDTNMDFDTATNFRFTPSVAGYYQIYGQVLWDLTGFAGNGTVGAGIYINGVLTKYGYDNASGFASTYIANVSMIQYFNGTTDYAELWCLQITGANKNNGGTNTYMTANYIRPL